MRASYWDEAAVVQREVVALLITQDACVVSTFSDFLKYAFITSITYNAVP